MRNAPIGWLLMAVIAAGSFAGAPAGAEEDAEGRRSAKEIHAEWREFIKPQLGRLIELGKSLNKIIWFHSCGDITDVLPDLIDMGIDVWETVQLHTLPISPARLKSEFGRHLTFFGGINSQTLPFSTPAAIESEVKARVSVLGKGGGYICGPDHTINADVPPENTIALFRAARECAI